MGQHVHDATCPLGVTCPDGHHEGDTMTTTDALSGYRRAMEDTARSLAVAYVTAELARLAAQDQEFGPDDPFPVRPVRTPELRVQADNPAGYGTTMGDGRRLHLNVWTTGPAGQHITFALGDYNGVEVLDLAIDGTRVEGPTSLSQLVEDHLDCTGDLCEWEEWVSAVHGWWTDRIERIIETVETAAWAAVAMDVGRRL